MTVRWRRGSREARLYRRVVELGVERAFEVLAAARRLEATGRKIIHLEAGEPDFPTPPHIVEAGMRALRDGHTTYTQSSGIQPLRVAIAESMRDRGVIAEPDNVVVVPGSKLALFHVLTALLEEGDEVLLPTRRIRPFTAAVTTFAGGRRRTVHCRSRHGRRRRRDRQPHHAPDARAS